MSHETSRENRGTVPKDVIVVYGLTEAEERDIQGRGHPLFRARCATDLIAVPAKAAVVRTSALDPAGRSALEEYLKEVPEDRALFHFI